MKKYLTMWQVWAGISVILMLLLIFKDSNFSAILPFAIFLICPAVMIFMMRGHKH